MIDPRRYLTAATLFILMAVVMLSFEFTDRGANFATNAATAKTDRLGIYDLSRGRILTKVVGHIRSHYVDPDRVKPRTMVVKALTAIQQATPEVIVTFDSPRPEAVKHVDMTVGKVKERFRLDRVRDLYELNWKLMDIFTFLQRHLPPATQFEDIEYAAVNGALETLDPHSVLVEPQVYREMQLGTHGKFGGLGVVISVRDGVLTVMSVMDDTPAHREGLKSGDKIVQIGEESTVNMPLNDAVNRLRGMPGSPVVIWVKREGFAEPKPYTITREEIRIRSVTHKTLAPGIGYVKLRNFQGNTYDDLEEALSKLTAEPEGLRGLVLDLRENPGGLLEQAIKISDRFLSHGTIVTTVRERGKARDERHATRGESLVDIPIVALINRGSASASEIVAGALKHNDRALVIGDTSFGKGSVQVIYQIDDAALKLTIAQYLTPGDVSIQSVGIVPDIEVKAVELDKKRLDLLVGNDDKRGEASLDQHLKNDKVKTVKPAVRLRMVEQRGTADDALVELASQILQKVDRTDRDRMLVQAMGLLDTRTAAETAKIGEALAKLGVDWSAGQTRRRAKPTVNLEVRTQGTDTPSDRFDSGDRIVLTAALTGDKKATMYRMHGVLRSDIHALDGVEVVFGKVEPGETRTWEHDLRLPRSLSTQGERVTLELYSDGKAIEKNATRDLRIKSLARPRFAYTAQVTDIDGNGDSLIQRGERISLTLGITNLGEGAAEDVLVTIKNESGEAVYIEQGRQRIGKLDSGVSEDVEFSLSVRKALKAQDVQLKVGIADQGLRTWTQDDLLLPVFPSPLEQARADRALLEVNSTSVQVHAGAHRDTTVVGVLPRGAVVPTKRRAGNWVEVALTNPKAKGISNRFGWAPADQFTASSRSEPNWQGVTTLFEYEPPELSITSLNLDQLITSQSTHALEGVARFFGSQPSRRYVYVFRNADKVFFQSHTVGEGQDDQMSFKTSVPLELGRNVLTIIAREGDEDVTTRTLIVYRQ